MAIGEDGETVLGRLACLWSQHREIQGEIDEIYEAIPQGGFMRGGAWVIVEDRDDARVWSMKPLLKRAEIECKMIEVVDAALSLGLDTELVRCARAVLQ